MDLDAALEELSWVPRPRILALRRLGIARVRDLLTHYPRRYENRLEFPRFPRDETVDPVCLCGDVVKTRLMRFGGRKIFEAVLEESGAHALSQPLTCRWFNLHYIQKVIATGQRLIIFGRIKRKGPRLVVDHPECEVIEDDEEILIHFRRITPVYPATEGLSQRMLRGLIFRLLDQVDVASADMPLPDSLGNGDDQDALRKIHFPESDEQLREVRAHLVLGEFFRMQMQIAAARAENSARLGCRHQTRGLLAEKFMTALPFGLTRAQQQVLNEIKHDLQLASPMNRLLQGDVGSGKTVVAIAAMLLAIESGSQAALMSPTQILAEQHYAVLRNWLDPLGIRIALRTGARQEDNAPLPLFAGTSSDSRRRARADADSDTTPQIIVGTHALLYENVTFSNLGLAVIDEQHKFGVAQRAKLTAREPAPDVLVMTATPIPRTLTMTVYGDLEVSTIYEMPRGRGEIITHLLSTEKLGEAITYLRQELTSGRQAYIIYPLIDESEKLDAKAAAKEFEQWQKRLGPFRCELLHGRIDSPDKEAIMQRFRDGETHALVSTTVIEVGVDIPNATVMVIENAERFGLSQLHQLRGRIGRGAHTSHCWLVSSDKARETMIKLAVLEKTTNGFEIAEADWELRGPGDLLGTAQSGLPGLKLGDLRRDAALMRKARRAALELLENDPGLDQPENQRFRDLIVERQGQTFSHVS
ncbi:MAG TPA: ATP-dependent DNA helicase RecG [Chthoniobacterales bacterium]|nr:ATP-dependent DNA helicase RecG [Chthoniobacterales bacterium]